MSPGLVVVLPGAVALALGLALPMIVRPLLQRLGIVDVPGHRSSHTVPTVRGMGLATATAALVAVLVALAAGAVATDRSVLLVVWAGMLLAGVLGWYEDWRGLAVRWRALAQLVIGLLVASVLTVVLGTSFWWIPVGALAVAAYVNVVNFMDGLNGISGLHGLVVGAAYAWAGWQTGTAWLTVCAVAVAAASLAFLPWNLLGTRVFLGDTGSYFLGGAIACCAVGAFLSGIYVEYLVPPLLIYLADTGVTLLTRIYRGEAWYQPHRQHVYQRLTDLGFSHLGSSAVVAGATALVSVIGVLSLGSGGAGMALAGLLMAVVVLLYLGLPRLLSARRERR